MAKREIPMSVRRAIAEIDPKTIDVTAFCELHSISRWSFYDIQRRSKTSGEAALELGSRRPHVVANKTPGDVEDQIVRIRKELDDDGLDAGSHTIHWHLERQGCSPPSVSTIYRILVRRGFVVPDPKKKPSAFKSFAAEKANEVWQIDGTSWELVDATEVKIMNIVDDCSRTCVASRVHDAETGEAAWEASEHGAKEWGLPERYLSDNGSAFKNLEKAMATVGVGFGHSRPYHPQTCGKVERFHQTLKKYLAKQPQAATKAELQKQIDAFVQIYNFERPHRGIDRRIPGDVWHATTKSGPANVPLTTERPTLIKRGTVPKNRAIQGAGTAITLPSTHVGEAFVLIVTNWNAHVFIDGKLVRQLELKPNQPSHPLHPRPGRPTKHV